MALRRRPLYILLSILGLFLIGTVVVLSSITYYLAIDPSAYLSDDEVPILGHYERYNSTQHGLPERIPRILHQTWRTDTLPEKWRPKSQQCRDLMPDYEYMLWTDNSSREFIAEHYPWFLDTFNDYTYPIQRADVIRYFVLNYYGGVYFDLDITCTRALDPLLAYPVILPKTIPVGVSNDLMFAEKGHPFLAQVIHSLVTFDHSWILNYPTVMFSTGPMFLSIQYSIFTSSHPSAQSDPIRILAKSLYGKNAKEGEAPNSFFEHFYGSSWHANDAGFIAFLNHFGKILMWIGLIVLIFGVISLAFPSKQRARLRRGGYEVLFPRRSRSGQWTFGSSSEGPDSPTEQDMPVLSVPVDVRASSPSPSDDQYGRPHGALMGMVNNIRHRFTVMTGLGQDVRTPARHQRQSYSRGVLFFLPAIFAQPQDIELGAAPPYSPQVPLLPNASRPGTPDKHRPQDTTNQGTSHSRAHGLIDFGGDIPSSSSHHVRHHSRSRSSSHHRDS